VHVAEENHDIALHGAAVIHAAEEADSVVHGLTRGDVNGAAKLDNVIIGAGWQGERNGKETKHKQARAHESLLTTDTPEPARRFPARIRLAHPVYATTTGRPNGQDAPCFIADLSICRLR